MLSVIWILSLHLLSSSCHCFHFDAIAMMTKSQASYPHRGGPLPPSVTPSTVTTTEWVATGTTGRLDRPSRFHQASTSSSPALCYRHLPYDDDDHDDSRRTELIRQEWNRNSVRYYAKVLREKTRPHEERDNEVPPRIGIVRQGGSRGTASSTSSSRHQHGHRLRSHTAARWNAIDRRDVSDQYTVLAKKHYFALRKIKDGKPHHAEHIYRRIIQELLQHQEQQGDHDDHCDHSRLAVTTLLLALHLQRNHESPKRVRSVFLHFFRTIITSSMAATNPNNDDGTAPRHSLPNYHQCESDESLLCSLSSILPQPQHQCACSAKVLQAFALFEMKQGYTLKSLQLILTAIQLDPSLKPILHWKQFRDAIQKYNERHNKK